MRIIGKNPNFLQELVKSSAIIRTEDSNKILIEYKTPLKFLKLADTKVARDKCRLFFGETFNGLHSHYVRYEKDFSYIKTFTRKYLSLLAGLLVNQSSEELLQDIRMNCAGNYSASAYSLTPDNGVGSKLIFKSN